MMQQVHAAQILQAGGLPALSTLLTSACAQSNGIVELQNAIHITCLCLMVRVMTCMKSLPGCYSDNCCSRFTWDVSIICHYAEPWICDFECLNGLETVKLQTLSEPLRSARGKLSCFLEEPIESNTIKLKTWQQCQTTAASEYSV